MNLLIVLFTSHYNSSIFLYNQTQFNIAYYKWIIIWRLMDIEIDRDRIVNQFKRNGHMLNKNSLEIVSEHLKNLHNPHRHLEELIKKMNQMVIIEQQDFNEKTLKLAIQLMSHRTEGGKSFNSYQKFVQHLKKWTIFYLSPYESNERFFVDKPDSHLFSFQPKDFLQMNKTRFKNIRDRNTAKQKKSELYSFLGVLFERFVGSKNKIMLQNQINQIQLIFPPQFQLQVFLIPGCTYIAHGDLKSSDLQIIVKKIQLPQPLLKPKQSLLSSKLKLVCDNISLSKSGLDFTVQDFRKYEIIYNKQQNKGKPILLFGNFKISIEQIRKVKLIIEKFPHKVQCVVLFIAQSGNQKLDLKKQIQNIPVYIVPHINSEGPRILPKIPILKHDYNAKVVTNPSRFSIQGKQCLFLNYPMVKNLYSKSLISKQTSEVNGQQVATKVSNMLFSQNNIGVTNKIFWKQSPYFDIHSDDIVFISDNVCPQINLETGKGGNFVSIGNFQNDGDFVFFLPHIKQSIQLSNNRE